MLAATSFFSAVTAAAFHCRTYRIGTGAKSAPICAARCAERLVTSTPGIIGQSLSILIWVLVERLAVAIKSRPVRHKRLQRKKRRGPILPMNMHTRAIISTRLPSCNDGLNQPRRGTPMNKRQLRSLSVDELWILHEEVSAALAAKLKAEKAILERRLSRLGVETTAAAPERRPYPPVSPKFRNPDEPSETWTGRGKQPRWLSRQLRSGKRIDDFRITAAAA